MKLFASIQISPGAELNFTQSAIGNFLELIKLGLKLKDKPTTNIRIIIAANSISICFKKEASWILKQKRKKGKEAAEKR